MNSKKVDILNIGLIIISLIIAVQLPFKLFLLSYAILGPLHYLTEIHWLNQQNYFVASKKNWIPLFFGFALIISVYPIIHFLGIELIEPLSKLNFVIASNGKTLILTAFIFAVSLIFVRKKQHLIFSLFGSIILAIGIGQFTPNILFFLGLFLPTMLHVYLFTFMFMLYGSLKSRSKYGFMSAALLSTVPFIIMFIDVNPNNYIILPSTFHAYESTNMMDVNLLLAKLTGGSGKLQVLSELGIKIRIFIAFAYTYHYLNWFSKTSIIGWQKSMSKTNMILILFIWAASVGIYYFDYETGLIALFFLSFLHVFLEFPLNVVSMKETASILFSSKKE
jgi:hypothetical protein